MIKFSWSLILAGDDFSPAILQQFNLNSLEMLSPLEKGDIEAIGRYKGKNVPFGSCILSGKKELFDFLDESFKLISRYEAEKSTIEEKLFTLTVAYDGQCNFELAPEVIRIIAEHNITLSISCYETNLENNI